MIYTIVETRKHRVDCGSRKEALSYAPEICTATTVVRPKDQSMRIALLPPFWAIKRIVLERMFGQAAVAWFTR